MVSSRGIAARGSAVRERVGIAGELPKAAAEPVLDLGRSPVEGSGGVAEMEADEDEMMPAPPRQERFDGLDSHQAARAVLRQDAVAGPAEGRTGNSKPSSGFDAEKPWLQQNPMSVR
jgi:hypothetical protein